MRIPKADSDCTSAVLFASFPKSLRLPRRQAPLVPPGIGEQPPLVRCLWPEIPPLRLEAAANDAKFC